MPPERPQPADVCHLSGALASWAERERDECEKIIRVVEGERDKAEARVREQAAQREGWEEAHDRVARTSVAMEAENTQLRADAELLRAECERLRSAVNEIAESEPQREGFPPLHWARDLARAALAALNEKPEASE